MGVGQLLRFLLLLAHEGVALGLHGLPEFGRLSIGKGRAIGGPLRSAEVVAHGAAVRKLSSDPELAETVVANYRAAKLDARTRAMLDFCWRLTVEPWTVGEEDRAALRAQGFAERDIWDIAAVAGFFNMSNRLASATDMRPNAEYYKLAR